MTECGPQSQLRLSSPGAAGWTSPPQPTADAGRDDLLLAWFDGNLRSLPISRDECGLKRRALTDLPCRIAGNDRAGRDVSRHDRVSADNGPLADDYAAQNYRTLRYPCVVANGNRSNYSGERRVRDVVGRSEEVNVTVDEDAFADCNGVPRSELYAPGQRATCANYDIDAIVDPNPRIHVAPRVEVRTEGIPIRDTNLVGEPPGQVWPPHHFR